MIIVLIVIILFMLLIIIGLIGTITQQKQVLEEQYEKERKHLIDVIDVLDQRLDLIGSRYSDVCADNRRLGKILNTNYPYEKVTQKLPKLPLDFSE